MDSLPNLLWLRAFETSARLNSFSAAAAELNLTQAAISHRVRSLEKTLAVQLFHRRSRKLDLTEIGRAYYPSVAKSLEELALSTRGLFGPSAKQTITVSALISTAAYWLSKRLAEYRRVHPDMQIRLFSALWADVVPDEHVDIDIRLGTGTFPGYQATLLSEEVMVPVCAAKTAQQITQASDLLSQDLIHIHGYQDHWATLLISLGLSVPKSSAGVSVDTSITAVELADAGSGVAMVMERLAKHLVADGRVVMPLAVTIPMAQGHYLLAPDGASTPTPQVQQFRDWIRAAFIEETVAPENR